MPLTLLTSRSSFKENPKIAKAAQNLDALLRAIDQKSIPESHDQQINEIMAGLNAFSGSDSELLKALMTGQATMLKLLKKELKIVPQSHYQALWLVLGMSDFGMPLGVAFGAVMGNMALLGIGLPVGISIGITIGIGMDTKAKNEGRQLDWKSS
jgi:uncharacterized oligopeptide transporter (OPT) family protein